MNLIPLQAVTMSASNVTGSTYNEWSASHGTYNDGDYVKITNGTTGLENEYECLVTHTADSDHDPETDTTSWLYLGASNKWALLDGFTNTQTENSTTIEITVAGESYIDTLALFNLAGTSVQVVTKLSGATLSDETYNLDEDIGDWYEYFFADFNQITDKLIEIPGLYATLTIEITITGATAKCGMLCLGRSKYLGGTEYSPKIGIEDYSAKDTNVFGETYLNQRAYSKTLSATLWLNTARIDVVQKALATVRSTAAVWQLNNTENSSPTNYESLIIYGFYSDFSIILSGPVQSACNLEIEGLI